MGFFQSAPTDLVVVHSDNVFHYPEFLKNNGVWALKFVSSSRACFNSRPLSCIMTNSPFVRLYFQLRFLSRVNNFLRGV